ncbi:MAG: HlyD family efflux transporter periplasmic adaptor subunit [Planctomycetes bacterium]|nr:HlyD family efflux transporter periplasmic adaptor subunit [Planctomycetota bacterium]
MRIRLCLLSLLLLAACRQDAPAPAGGSMPQPARVTNRIDIPPTVVQNLGITFARVERRHVSRTLRLPGAFESPPQAVRAYAAPVGGRVTLLVSQYQRVTAGQPLYRLDSPEMRRLLHEIADADAEATQRHADVALARSELDAATRVLATWPARLGAVEAAIEASQEHSQNLQAALELWSARVTQLEDLEKAGGGRASELAEARSRRADAEAAVSNERETRAGFNADLAALKAGLEADRARMPGLNTGLEKARAGAKAADMHAQMVRHEAASTLGLGREELAGDAWQKLDQFTQVALADGVVSTLHATEGEVLAAGGPVLRTLDDKQVRFRARALQADLGLLSDDLDVAIVPPSGGPLALAGALAGKLTIAPESDADSRTVDVIVHVSGKADWARPGVTAEAEVVYDKTEEARLAIPLACVMQDGLDKIFFRRDPADSAKVIRVAASIGISDGRWVVINTGAIEGDEIVLHGAYELKLTGAGKASGKGHFHADGTWHEGDH